MIVSQHDLELILNPRIRQRVFHLPVRYGRWGERKRCPARKGGVYVLRASVTDLQRRYRIEASAQPTHARALVSFIDLCEQPATTVLVTVRERPELLEDGSAWLVRFMKGDQRHMFDGSRYLAAHPGPPSGDYTSVASMKLVGTNDEVDDTALARYANEGELRHADFLSEARKRALDAIEDISQYSTTRSDRRRLRAAAFQIRMMERRDDAA